MKSPKSRPATEFSRNEIAHMIQRVFASLYRGKRRGAYPTLRLSGLVHEEVRGIIRHYLESTIKKLGHARDARRQILTESDVLHVTSYVPSMTPRLKKCPRAALKVADPAFDAEWQNISKRLAERSKRYYALNRLYREQYKQNLPVDPTIDDEITAMRDEIDELTAAKQQLYDDHVGAVMEQRQAQIDRDGSCFHLSPLTLRRVVESIVDGAFSLTEDALLLLQFDVEYHLTIRLTYAFRVMFHAKRETLMPKDLNLTRHIMSAETAIRRPRLEFPESDASYQAEYVQVRDKLEIDERRVSPKLVEQLDRFNYLLIALLVEYASLYKSIDKQPAVDKHHVEAAVDAIFPSELASFARTSIRKANERGESLVFNIRTDVMFTPDAARCLGQVVEYMNAELINAMDGLHSSAAFHATFEQDDDLMDLGKHLEFVVLNDSSGG